MHCSFSFCQVLTSPCIVPWSQHVPHMLFNPNPPLPFLSAFIYLIIHFSCNCEFHYLSYLFSFSWVNFHPPVFFISSFLNFPTLFSLFPYLFMCPSSSCLSYPSHPSFPQFFVSSPVGAGCVRRPSSVSLTCRSTPSRTQRPNLTSVLTAPSHSPTPATWPSTSASTVGPSLTPAPTARNLSGSSVTYSSTHGTADSPPHPHSQPSTYCPFNLSCSDFQKPCLLFFLPPWGRVRSGVQMHISLPCKCWHATSPIQKWPFQKSEFK